MKVPSNWEQMQGFARIGYAITQNKRDCLSLAAAYYALSEREIGKFVDDVIAYIDYVPRPGPLTPRTIGDYAKVGAEICGIPYNGPSPVSTANEVQVGGEHYRLNGKYQIWDLVVDMGWDFFQGNAISYIHRYKQKGGVDDLRKARHYLDKMIEIEEAKTTGEKS
jgi:hypothetical protein